MRLPATAARLALIAAVLAGPLTPARAAGPARRTDLTGFWTSSSLTMLERPAGIGALTVGEAEAPALEKRVLAADKTEIDDIGGRASEIPWWDFGERFTRIDGQPRTSLIVDPPDCKLPFSAAGLAARAADIARHQSSDNPETRTASEQCLLGGWAADGPPMMNAPYANALQIVQTRDFVAIALEMVHDVRVIPIVAGPADARHGPKLLRRWLGDSVGWWEGATLVVETVHFNPGDALKFPTSLYVSPEAKVTERFSRLADGRILYAFTVDDPATYTKPWRAEMVLYPAKGALLEYSCHEGNYSLPGMLAGARVQERAAK